MRSLYHFLFLILLIVCAVLVMNSHLFRVFDIAPNILISLFAVFAVSRIRVPEFLGVSALLFLFVYILFPFWIAQYFFIIIAGMFMILIRAKLTGNTFTDLSLLISLGTAIFFALAIFFTSSPFLVLPILFEIAYNVVLGIMLLILLKRYLE